MLNPIKGEKIPSLEAWSLATAVSKVTQKVIIAQTTLCEAFRYPAILAKQATTLNEIRGGRFWLGIWQVGLSENTKLLVCHSINMMNV